MSAFWTQYCPGLTALLLWLTSASATRPPRTFASGAAVLEKCESALALSSRVRSAAHPPVQQRLQAAPDKDVHLARRSICTAGRTCTRS